MALAYLEILDTTPSGIELLADIGTNAYYQYYIGSASTDSELDRLDFESPLQKYEHGAFAQPLRFRIPANQVPRGSRQVQLVSFRDERRNGPAWSRVLGVQPHAFAGSPDEWSDLMSLRGRFPRATPYSLTASAPLRARAFVETPVAKTPAIAVRPGATFDVFRERIAVFQPTTGIGIPVELIGVAGEIPRAIAELVVLDAETGVEHVRAETRAANVRAGIPVQLRLDSTQLASVPRHRRLRADITLRWPAPAGVQRVRTSLSFQLAERAFVVAMSAYGNRPLATDDPEVHRAFWHRIWAWRVPSESEAIRWELDLACRYTLQTNASQSTNGRLETRALLDEADPEDLTYALAGKLKSGLELSPDDLAHLTRASPDHLATIRATPACTAKLAAVATTRLRAKGKRANEMEIWAVPGFEARTIALHAITASDEDGRVTSTEPIELEFPFPAKVRFITLTSIPTVDELAPFPGFEVAADETVTADGAS